MAGEEAAAADRVVTDDTSAICTSTAVTYAMRLVFKHTFKSSSSSMNGTSSRRCVRTDSSWRDYVRASLAATLPDLVMNVNIACKSRKPVHTQ